MIVKQLKKNFFFLFCKVQTTKLRVSFFTQEDDVLGKMFPFWKYC